MSNLGVFKCNTLCYYVLLILWPSHLDTCSSPRGLSTRLYGTYMLLFSDTVCQSTSKLFWCSRRRGVKRNCERSYTSYTFIWTPVGWAGWTSTCVSFPSLSLQSLCPADPSEVSISGGRRYAGVDGNGITRLLPLCLLQSQYRSYWKQILILPILVW